MTNRSITQGSSAAVAQAAGPPAQATPTVTDVQTAPAVVDPATIGYLAFRVLKDPEIRKPWRDAAKYCSSASALRTLEGAARAATSVAIAGRETSAAWRRHGATAPLLRGSDAEPNAALNAAR